MYGKKMWDKMCATGYLDAITVTINRALCECKCEKCGTVKNICVGPPFDWKATYNCDCGRWKGMHIVKMLKDECNIPQRDIDIAYRAAKGDKIHPEEWD